MCEIAKITMRLIEIYAGKEVTERSRNVINKAIGNLLIKIKDSDEND